MLASRRIEGIVLQVEKLDLTGKLMVAMLAVVAEMERGLLVKRTQLGLIRAKEKGTALGRPVSTTADQ